MKPFDFWEIPFIYFFCCRYFYFYIFDKLFRIFCTIFYASIYCTINGRFDGEFSGNLSGIDELFDVIFWLKFCFQLEVVEKCELNSVGRFPGF